MDPTLRIKIIAQLKDHMAELSPQMRTAAKYIVDHPSDFGLDPIRDTASKAKVSTYTLVNIAKKLGFSGFEDLRRPFRSALIEGASGAGNTDRFDQERQQGDLGKVFADSAENALSIVKRSLDRQQLSQLEAVVDMLIGARSVYLTAVRSSYAVAYYFHYVGRMALPSMQLIPRHMNSAIDDLNDAEPGDVLVAITVTPYSTETIKACEYAKKRGLKLLLISDSEIVSPHLQPEQMLVTSVLSTHHFGCFSGMMAVVEMLVAFLMHRGGQGARDRIASYETVRIENNAYWVAQKKH
nr:MurR/RpiR family transcriptional regulator [uncultured Shimia sp.]